jgi:hypothetical protein
MRLDHRGDHCPDADEYLVELAMNHFIVPTQPFGQGIEPVAVTTPEEVWPITGLGRLLFSAFGPPSIWGPGGPGWPDEPWWKLSGFFDLTWDQSIRQGVKDLEAAMDLSGNNYLVISGYSQGAVVANLAKQRLAAQYPAGTKAPDIDFVLQGDLNLPNGGIAARFSGLYVPIVDVTFNGPAPTDTQFDTVEINRQYDGYADFPLYPIDLVADVNAVLGILYVHLYDFDVSLADDRAKYTLVEHGDTDYYFFETQDLPLFGPLRTLGVPEPVIDVVEPVFRWAVELGYDRSIPPWKPTPARLIPTHDPATVATDLVNAVRQGINNAAALIGSPPPLKVPAPDTSTVTTHRGADAADDSPVGSQGEVADLNVGDGISHSLSAPNRFRTKPGNNPLAADEDNSGPQPPRGGWTKLNPQVAARRLQVHTPQAGFLQVGQPDRRASGEGRDQHRPLAPAGK